MKNPVDGDSLEAIVDREQESVLTNPQAIALNAGKFLNLRTTRLNGQLFDALENEATQWRGEGTQVFLNAPIVGEEVHALDEPLPLQALKELGVRECPPTRPDGPGERDGVLPVLDETHKPSVVR